MVVLNGEVVCRGLRDRRRGAEAGDGNLLAKLEARDLARAESESRYERAFARRKWFVFGTKAGTGLAKLRGGVDAAEMRAP